METGGLAPVMTSPSAFVIKGLAIEEAQYVTHSHGSN